MDRLILRQVPYQSADHQARVQLPHVIGRSIGARAAPGPLVGTANMADIRRAMLHSALRKTRHSQAPAFSPSKWGGKKFRLCARRHRKSLRKLNRDLRARDTSSQLEEAVPSIS